jgi:hypothetical protein
MPSGGPGDGEVMDILLWRRPVFSLRIDSLIAELAELSGAFKLEDFLREHGILRVKPSDPEKARFEAALSAKRDDLYRSATASGWDMEDLDSRIKAQREAVAGAWNQSGWCGAASAASGATVKARRDGCVHCDVPLDLSAPRYKDRPLLGFLDAYALAVIGQLSAEDEPIVAAAVNRAFGNTDDWKTAVRHVAGLPEDFDARLRKFWDQQPAGTGTIAFVLAVSDANFAPLIDPIGESD